MHDYIYKYLVLTGKLSIPQLGNIFLVTEPASVDRATMQLLPPLPVFHFEETDNSTVDKSFLLFITNEMGVAQAEASQTFLNFSGQFRQDIQAKPMVNLKGIGKFTKGDGGSILLTPDDSIHELFPSITLEQETIEQNEVVESGKDYWWFYAIILFVMGLGAMIYYYI